MKIKIDQTPINSNDENYTLAGECWDHTQWEDEIQEANSFPFEMTIDKQSNEVSFKWLAQKPLEKETIELRIAHMFK